MANDDGPVPTEPKEKVLVAIPQTRGYQQEMLDESLRRNIVIALDTGAGKTHIAVLRVKLESERQSKKVRGLGLLLFEGVLTVAHH